MFEVVSAFGFGELVEGVAAEFPELIGGPFGAVTQEFLELGKGQLNRVQVGRVGGQVAQLGAGRFDRLADASHLVAGEVVHHHDVAWLQDRSQMLFDPPAEQCAVDGPFHGERGDEPLGS